MWKKLLILVTFAVFAAACGGSGATDASKPATEHAMPIGALLNEYSQSKEATKSKYTGKTLTVRGYTTTAPIMPNGTDDAGILIIMEKGGDMLKTLTCSFTAADKAEFSRIKGDQIVTIRGVFNDEMSTGLKSCKLVEIQ